jgi:UDP-N-acetylglucosamine 2-epimerase (non-hydrolysing)
VRALFIFGTRPEAIKLAPLIKACQNASAIETLICITGQHKEMLDQVLDFFEIVPDFDLKLMRPNQTLFDITSDGLIGLKKVLSDSLPDLIFVQGDTTTAFIGALAGYYNQIQVAHIEAGLRSGDKYSPFPEEVNRMLIGDLANYHFVPTPTAHQNLLL